MQSFATLPLLDLSSQYLAGLVDGEGCFTYYHKKSKFGPKAMFLIGMRNCDLQQTMFSAIANREQLAKFIEDVSPFLVLKKEKALAMLEYIRHGEILLRPDRAQDHVHQIGYSKRNIDIEAARMLLRTTGWEDGC